MGTSDRIRRSPRLIRLKRLIGLVALGAALTHGSVAAASVIYQAFEESFDSLLDRLDWLADAGYDYIQISPPQKSISEPIWWAKYQPVDLRVIEGPLGNEKELRTLITAAHKRGLKVLVDVVLNHMADPVFHPGDLQYPEFSWRDFHFHQERPCISDWNNRFEVTHKWICDPAFPDRRLPDLDTSSPYVRGVHKRYLERLLAMGVDGFRIDAAKHIEPEYFLDVLRVVPEDRYVYGEVIGTSIDESNLYTPLFQVTDFHLLGTMIRAFALGGSLADLTHPEGYGAALPSTRAVTMVRNHDTVMHPRFFGFPSYGDAVLAYAYGVGRGNGVAMVYRDDAANDTVAAAVRFHRRMRGKPAYVRPVAEICGGEAGCDGRTLLVMERGGRGVVMINKSDQWLDVPRARLPGMSPGCYRELRYGTAMIVEGGGDGQRWVAGWGSRQRGGLQIGPRTALFFVPGEGCP